MGISEFLTFTLKNINSADFIGHKRKKNNKKQGWFKYLD